MSTKIRTDAIKDESININHLDKDLQERINKTPTAVVKKKEPVTYVIKNSIKFRKNECVSKPNIKYINITTIALYFNKCTAEYIEQIIQPLIESQPNMIVPYQTMRNKKYTYIPAIDMNIQNILNNAGDYVCFHMLPDGKGINYWNGNEIVHESIDITTLPLPYKDIKIINNIDTKGYRFIYDVNHISIDRFGASIGNRKEFIINNKYSNIYIRDDRKGDIIIKKRYLKPKINKSKRVITSKVILSLIRIYNFVGNNHYMYLVKLKHKKFGIWSKFIRFA